MDRRRRHYAALDVYFPWSDTCERLHEEFGHVGPLAFIYLVLACKAAPVQGEVTYITESDFWVKIGMPLEPEPPDLEAFLTMLARYKQLSRRTAKQRTESARRANRQRTDSEQRANRHVPKTVRLTNWDEWQDAPKRYHAAARKAAWRQRHQETDTRDDKRSIARDDTEDNGVAIGVQRGEETKSKRSLRTQSVGGDTTPSAANPNGSAPGSPPAEQPHPQPGQTPADYVTHHGWTLPEGQLATVLIDHYPDLDDPAILELLKHAGELQREHEAEAEILF